ncbi:MAG: SOS response-associated peptidase [Myxococcales bacterium]|nr:SOS response-associated peptidase [Myxococcales bacterium]
MCGRMTLTSDDLDAIAASFDAEVDPEDAARYRPHYNIAPTALHWIAVAGGGRRRLIPAAWGIAGGPRLPLVINARAETVAEKPLFRDAFRRRRCVVPADGFFEWIGPPKDRRPIWFHAQGGGLLLFAGLYDETEAGARTFAVITTDANAIVAPVHNRMPALLDREEVREWLTLPARELLVPAPPERLIGREVSRRVNSAENDDPACLAPPEAPVPERQLRLL